MAQLGNSIILGTLNVTSFIKEEGILLSNKYAGNLSSLGTTLYLRDQVNTLDLDSIDLSSVIDSRITGGTGITYSAGTISIDSTVATETWVTNNFNNYVHPSSAQTSINNSGATVIQDVTLDSDGHVTGLGSKTLTYSDVGADPAGTINYIHPSHPGDDINIDTGPLIGATVISDLDFNVTTDTQGHVTDANAVIVTRNLTLGDLGFTGDLNANYFTYTHPSDGGGSRSLLSGATVINGITVNSAGHVTGTTIRDLTLSDLGYTGDSNANNYIHPSHPGDDINIDTGPLTGATVISDLDFNVTTDLLGHVTDANAVVVTRNLTYSDVGAASSGHLHDDRYYTETESDTRYIKTSSDGITQTINFNTAGTLVLQSNSDYQLKVKATNTSWAGIYFEDSGGIDPIWYNGAVGNFAIGGGGSSSGANKKLHIHGGVTIGTTLANIGLDNTGDLYVENEVKADNGYKTGDFHMQYDATSKTLNFNYIG